MILIIFILMLIFYELIIYKINSNFKPRYLQSMKIHEALSEDEIKPNLTCPNYGAKNEWLRCDAFIDKGTDANIIFENSTNLIKLAGKLD